MLQVCRHHAAAVCDKAHGNTNHFACPYHGWVYGKQRTQPPKAFSNTVQCGWTGSGVLFSFPRACMVLGSPHNTTLHNSTSCIAGVRNVQQTECPVTVGWNLLSVPVGLDGRLQKATKLKGIKNFKASEMGLLPAPVGTWQGFAFVHPGPLHGGTLDVYVYRATLS